VTGARDLEPGFRASHTDVPPCNWLSNKYLSSMASLAALARVVNVDF
jgi:hypothetical protein